jgi:anti-sigma-K factor RskA
MSSAMTHEEVRELLAAQAMELLDGDERTAVLAHIASCPECTAELESLRGAAAELALVAPARSFDARRCNSVRSRLLARTGADREARARLAAGQLPDRQPPMLRVTDSEGTRSMSPGWRVGSMLLAAAGAAMIVIGGALLVRGRQESAAARNRAIEREPLIAGVVGPGVRIIELAGTEQRAGSARLFWNQSTDAWTFVARGLPAPRAGRAYQLWLITPDDRKISAGVFTPARTGEAVATATYALAPDSLAAVAVTEEPAGGVAVPTGEIVMRGRGR